MNGLKDRTRRELKIRAVKDLDNAMAIATNLEQDFDSIQNVNYIKTRNNDKKFFVNRNINKTTNFNNKPFKKRFISELEDNKNKNTWNKSYNKPKNYSHQIQPDRNVNKTVINCHRCKGKGYYANQCNIPIKKINQIHISNSDSEEYEIEQINTLTNSPNHITRSKALINGIELTVGFDSETTVSVLSHDIAVKNKIEIQPSDCKVKTATGLITKVSGKTSQLEVVINNHICMIEFVVFDHEDNDVLLGLDWFCKTKCGIYPYKAMLSFPEDKIYLNEDIKELQDRDDTADMFLSELNVDEVELEEEYFWDMSDLKLEPASKLNSKELTHFEKLKYSASKMFANEIDELGACSILEHIIRIKSDNQ
ncbi:unnamed protein product [Brachionus calyciflorus]|uniref:Uncharacterized protein n=1 Tax=Brachionus calyciflorus TaxID=104777 RepID=A0A814GAC5_9BILA|nr:unnamed protein product [Brachionus calyciflorus]